MQVKVQVYAILRQYIPDASQGPLVMEVPEGITVGQLIERLPIPSELARVVFVNGTRQEPDWVLREGDEIGIFPPIAGGKDNG
ncbi:MoaD/ThiS family protein [Thermoflexus sp.]|uniref:MoaD/ThiS family protein n=1 Tax=Thermoflexus sp. TaxID=1969742 RepID=UPI0025F6009D|nr:MoaD/ThiS family protein [Thermoflexus sp.]MDW8180237.1 MoaD/ThiS family protein [Anaerolineae bacterium]MCS6962655.1 MoaD/ThiS family protein [Thermoflexus sp.]MCS7350786.1 MoaD/ThiS family protein [Thermoflexus sp.]MCX7689870.1 MoaD/ThiS family protein [Thermoflexus sp.]MDW8183804.1 MoaD/ThiS family protein [Anaerolineae bacterium]